MATMTLAVAATGDDAWGADNGTGTGYYTTNTSGNIGNHAGESGAVMMFFRFAHADVALLNGAVINSALFKPKKSAGNTGTPLTNVYMERAASPAAPSSNANMKGRTNTTAFTAVDNPAGGGGTVLSIDVKAQLEEVLANHTVSGALVVLHRDDGSAGGFNLLSFYDYSNNPADAATLEIDYTPLPSFVAAATGSVNPTTSFTVTIPTVQVDDWLILAFTSRNHTSGDAQPTVTDNDTGGNTWQQYLTSSDRKAQVWRKKATSATSGKTITVSGCINSSSGVLKAFRGVDPTTPMTNGVIETNASGNETHASITPTNAKSMACGIVFNYANDNAVTTPAFATDGALTMTEHLSSGGTDCATMFGHAARQTGASPNATGAFTWAQVDGTTYSFVFALAPIAAPLNIPILRLREVGY